MTELQRLGGIIISPGKTFEDIQQRPTWVLPFALLVAFHLFGDFVLFRVMITDANFEQMARAKVQWDAAMAGRQNSPVEERQQIGALRREREQWYVLTLIAVPLSLLVLRFSSTSSCAWLGQAPLFSKSLLSSAGLP
ncbi:MAG TPA: hypothetical protein VNB49_14875 [Candidatus Dormibacteraeota bacterium]|nr:hypothetical protein [Candidatus Dormibacteraeota bacterium]